MRTVGKYLLKLYVTGRTSRSERAIANLRRICAEELPGQCEVMIVDVLERPELAEEDRILATPTLIRESPPPARRIIGDLSDPKLVVFGLSLYPDVALDPDPGLFPSERPRYPDDGRGDHR